METHAVINTDCFLMSKNSSCHCRYKQCDCTTVLLQYQSQLPEIKKIKFQKYTTQKIAQLNENMPHKPDAKILLKVSLAKYKPMALN